ncbi:double-strand break repair helicase AddA [Rhodoblastus acidophilus]|uniref:DNA 3'-5' helicase n=1 Tax=Candidatus Rhodoblastus alkanivorans TaxID=2954117 RepID=A0ABS9Z301_9HYPH|nr:double-strand break repair helicase AddA [Candidatus Rhodoblastus alkanivorans]MCI4679745.1 double-strand break repair helicase AddA [Candidatus Rhodoblastus alkanivorans]MCI4681983.1 double-strand break repair helicase AddA [Candidatus Rhodoblastus alkanivorans]MDI4643034.1 double-strand break repair helicase AddA [Rhodoblastus acidophilus]
MSGARKIPEATRARQALASDPKNSAWVSANAGSGKTHVLAQRVIRLLLAGVAPGRILCLTFTKAAAANMAARVFQTLAKWTALDDEALREAIGSTGAGRPRERNELDFARKLFARAVETPGGLKIQTIHAFCERVLHAAPFEANVAAGFAVVEDVEQQQLIARARRETLRQAEHDQRLGAALARVAQDAGLVFDKLLNEALSRRAAFRAAAPGALSAALGVAPGETPEALRGAMLEQGVGPRRWLDFAAFLRGGKKTDAANAEAFEQAHRAWKAGAFDAAREALFTVFFTLKGEPAKKLLTADLAKARPDLLDELTREQDRLNMLRGKIKAAETAERSLALIVVVNAILDRYESIKAERQILDFEDLIARTGEMLKRSSARWILQKLDAGIDHILVDEAQDTSAAQWDILDLLSGDFFAGAGQARRLRSFFAVGDEKQSIFSFQGAEPKLFATKKAEFQKRAKAAQMPFEPVELTLSFRSAPGVLEAVDKVFEKPEHFRGLSAQEDHVRTVHEALKRDLPARIEIWNVIEPGEKEESRDWRLPLDFRDEADPPVADARRIAETIRLWLQPGSGETVHEDGARRALRPGDIMILVRRRDAFFDAMIRALREKGVPAAGADRLQLAQHIAVMDLVAIGRAALLPEDDLTLATALKTPVFGFDDEDLLCVAPLRRGALQEALRASGEKRFQEACARLDLLRRLGRALPPFAFFARLLGPLGARRAFLSRLGPEAGDALDEFLNLAFAHERARAPSLAAFLGEVAGLDVSIKRDMDLTSSFVRVMTVHAAKGLEAKIVFLPDVCGAPAANQDGALFPLATAKGDQLAWSPKKDFDCAAVADARQKRQELAGEEYRRLLYVAMTRAEERLYVAGHRGARAIAPESWRAMIENALGEGAVEAPAPWGGDEKVMRFGPPETVLEAPAAAPAREETRAAPPPAWLFAPAAAELAAPPPLRPSSAFEGADQRAAEAAPSPQRAQALEEGRLVHRLLQFLPDLPRDARRAAALRDLAAQGPGAGRVEKLVAAAIAVLDDPRLEPLFGARSIAEARIAARLEKPGGGFVEIVGAIDRMAETEDGVWLADYKTGAPSPERRPAHVAQLALYRAGAARLYPGKRVRCVLIHAGGPVVEEIPAAELDAALEAALRLPGKSN